MRGFFGIGVEGLTKPMNLGNLVRSAHAFGASFFFLIETDYSVTLADTSVAQNEIPLYSFDHVEEMTLPQGCQLIGIELTDDAIDLPTFRHPRAAAYILGPEKGSLSDEVLARCDHVVKVPTSFCINVATCGAVVMYDRIVNLGRFPARPLVPGGEVEPLPPHVHGEQVIRNPKK